MVYKIRHNEHFTFITIVFFSFSSSTIFSLFNNINICSVLLVSPSVFYSKYKILIATIYEYYATDINLYTRQPFHIAPFTIYIYKPNITVMENWQSSTLYEPSTNLFLLSFWNIPHGLFVKCSIYLCDCLSTWGCYLRNTFFYSEDHLFLSTPE